MQTEQTVKKDKIDETELSNTDNFPSNSNALLKLRRWFFMTYLPEYLTHEEKEYVNLYLECIERGFKIYPFDMYSSAVTLFKYLFPDYAKNIIDDSAKIMLKNLYEQAQGPDEWAILRPGMSLLVESERPASPLKEAQGIA